MSRSFSASTVFSMVLLAAVLRSTTVAQRLNVTQAGDRLEVVGQVAGSIHEVNLWIESSRNNKITKMSDVSPLNPDPKANASKNEDRDVSYPVVDVRLEPGMVGVMKFDTVPKVCTVNGEYFKDLLQCTSTYMVPANHLLYWENTVFAEPAIAAVTHFYLKQPLPVVDGRVHFELQLLSPEWSGSLSMHTADTAETELSRAKFATKPVQLPVPPEGPALSRERLLWSLNATVTYILRARDLNPLSPTYNGLNLFYDLDAQTYRSPYWVWGWGPEVNVLVGASKTPEIARAYPDGELLRDADRIGKTSLGFVVSDPENAAKDISFSRWDRSLNFPLGFSERIAPSDSNFLSKWAWIPLYQATGDVAYLDAAKALAEATEKLVKKYDFIPQEYITDERRWADTTIDESGFGTDGLSALYQSTKDPKYKQYTLDYIDQHMRKLQREDGLWNRGWNAKTGVMMPSNYNTRAMGWAMEGMLAANQAAPEGPYLAIAKKMADHLLTWQLEDGSWAFVATASPRETGFDDKGTPLWSHLLYELYGATHDIKYLNAARKALGWCIANQYEGPDPQAFGGLVGITPHSAVGYRPFFRVTGGYTSGFFGVAVLEELALQNIAAK